MLTTQRRLRSNNVLAVPGRPRYTWPLYIDRDRKAYRAAIAELLDLDARDPARRRRVDEKFGSSARFARRFPSLQDAWGMECYGEIDVIGNPESWGNFPRPHRNGSSDEN